MLTPLIITLLVQAAGGRPLGQLMSAISLPIVVVPIFGPVVAGLIISNIGWRWIFYVNVPICLAGLSIYGAMLLLPLYFQQARHDTALVAGLLMVPQGLGSLLPRTLAGKLTDKIGPRLVVLAGVALAAAGTIPFALAGLHTSYWLLGAALVVRGAGLGTATIAVMAGAFIGLSPAQVPHASSATRIVQFVGGVLSNLLAEDSVDRRIVRTLPTP